MGRKKKPLPQDECVATVEALSHEGRGIVRYEGKKVFLKGVLPQEEVRFKWTKSRRHYGEGRMTQIISADARRQPPICQHFTTCGGCTLQHMPFDHQMRFKQDSVLELLKAQEVIPLEIAPPIQGPECGYRHKARLGVRYVLKKDKVLVGFRETGTNKIAQLSDCKILPPSLGSKLQVLGEVIHSLSILDKIPQVEYAGDSKTHCLVFRHLEPFSDEDQQKLIAFCEHFGFALFFQPSGPESVQQIWPMSPKVSLGYSLLEGKIHIAFSVNDFTQINPYINQKMVPQAIDWLSLTSDDRVLDLFCGLGNFSLPIALSVHSVLGIEGSQTMVEKAKQNAEQNGCSNAQFVAWDLREVPKINALEGVPFTKALIDPPRTGAKEVISWLASTSVKTLLYVSCNPTTFSRDAGLLKKQGFILKKMGLMDMFPHTAHVEVMGLFVQP